MTLVASRQLSAVLAPAGKSTALPRKLCAPIAARDVERRAEKSALMNDSPSATIVPLPIVERNGLSC